MRKRCRKPPSGKHLCTVADPRHKSINNHTQTSLSIMLTTLIAGESACHHLKIIATSAFALLSAMFAPVFPYAAVCTLFVGLDFVSAWQLGRRIRRSKLRHKRASAPGKLSSRRFGRTVATLAKIYTALVAASLVQEVIVDGAPAAMGFDCVKFTAAAVCFWQLVSILENESTCSDASWAKIARRFLADKTYRHTGIDLRKK